MTPDLHEIGAERYHADDVGASEPTLSASIAHLLCSRSPLHAWTAHPRLNPDFEREEKTTFDIGSVAHTMLLEGDEERVTLVLADDWRTKAAKEAREIARAEGRIPILAKDFDKVTMMLSAGAQQLKRYEIAPPPFRDGKAEQTLVWEDSGVTCRARLDWLRNDLAAIDDFKTTTASAEPAAWSKRTMFAIGADLQSGFYRRGVKTLTGSEPTFRYVVQETYQPYALSVVEIGADVLAVANAKVDYALRTWRACLDKDEWPAYPREVHRAELPAWADDSKWLVEEAA